MHSTDAKLPAIEDGPLRVLLFTALPDDIGKKEQLRIEEEQALVLEALGQWRQSGHVLLEMPDDGRFSEFTHQLHHFRPHLVYLSGHGKVIVQGALAQRGIAVKFIESWLDREIGQRAVAQMGWVRNLAILGGYLITSGAVTATMKLELGI